jgi:hypothetical protein
MVAYLIKPYSETITYKISYFDVYINNIVLDSCATLTITFYDESNIARRQEVATLDGEDYMNWTTDTYLVNWVCKKYNLVLQK